MIQDRTDGTVPLCAIVLTLCCLGCNTSRPSSDATYSRAFANVAAATVAWRHEDQDDGFDNALLVLESDNAFADTVRIAREAEIARSETDPRCVSLYAKVAIDCWPMLPADDQGDQSNEIATAAWKVYHFSVAQFVGQSLLHGQIDPQSRVSYSSKEGESMSIPITHHGFPWAKGDFGELRLAENRDHEILDRYWSERGLGVPVIAVRQCETSQPYMSPHVPFSATCILRPRTPEEASREGEIPNQAKPGEQIDAVLELQDPLRVQQVAYGNRQWNLASDVSAPLAMASRTIHRDKISSFLNPGRADENIGLRMLEPYQPGRIPLVFVHGLLSDKFTWVDLVNDLRAVEGLNEHYQIWSFQYPTGQPFIRSAADMRRDLTEIIKFVDPQGSDPALTQMVLVGHSMGGLISKLQVSRSETAIWDSVASRRVEEIHSSPETRDEIEHLFFFEPLPFVKRVVFIGSPHRGSKIAKGFVGRLGSALVITPNENESRFKAFVRENPDIFMGDLAHRLPSSVDLLRPDNPMLLATYKLRVNPDVRLHTIIGTGHEVAKDTPGDGVVAVDSARHPGTVSELHIETTHTHLTGHPKTTTEIVRVLGEHLNENYVPELAAAELLP